MTLLDPSLATEEAEPKCPACGRVVPPRRHSGGHPKIYCSERCRNAAATRRHYRGRPRRYSRRPLPDAARDAGWRLRKAVESVEHLMADDRLRANKDQVAVKLGGHLQYAADACARMASQLNEEG